MQIYQCKSPIHQYFRPKKPRRNSFFIPLIHQQPGEAKAESLRCFDKSPRPLCLTSNTACHLNKVSDIHLETSDCQSLASGSFLYFVALHINVCRFDSPSFLPQPSNSSDQGWVPAASRDSSPVLRRVKPHSHYRQSDSRGHMTVTRTLPWRIKDDIRTIIGAGQDIMVRVFKVDTNNNRISQSVTNNPDRIKLKISSRNGDKNRNRHMKF